MKNFMLFLAVLLTADLMMAGCAPITAVRSSGKLVTQEFAFGDFTRIDVASAFEVTVRQGDSYQVTIEVDEAAVPYLRVEQQGDTLQIGLGPTMSLMGNLRLRGDVTLPALSGLEASGASQVELNGFNGDQALNIRASGASGVQGAIDAGDAKIEASGASQVTLNSAFQDVAIEATGASKVTLSGSGRNVTVTAAGASPVDLAEFPVADATIRATGASNVIVYLSGTLDADASGASSVTYSGSPTLGDIRTAGASSVSRR
jgi:hypothetical protein